MDIQMEIYHLLLRLGLTANYTCFFHTAYAIQLCVENQERLLLVTKRIYPEVARRYQTNWKAVERNIRTARDIIWRQSWSLLEALANQQLPQKLFPAQFLSILTYHILSTQEKLPLVQ